MTTVLTFIAVWWWAFMLLGVFMYIGISGMIKDAKDLERTESLYGPKPSDRGCKRGPGGHEWQTGHWNSGWYHHGAFGRRGWRCYRCGEMHYTQTDQEYAIAQVKHAAWVIKDPECKIPESFIQYIPQELLDIREENIHNREIEKARRAAEYHKEQEIACNVRLFELQSA